MADVKSSDFSIPLSVPEITGNEASYVGEALRTGWISSAGPFVERFEREFCQTVGAPHAVAVSSGTAALHLALYVAGVQAGDDVFVPSLTFIATAFAAHYVGASPIFIDCDPYFQLSAQHLRELITRYYTWDGKVLSNKLSKRRASAIIPTHLLGHACDMDPLMAIAKEFGLIVIEDACEGLGTLYKGQPVGNFGKAASFSFNGNKIISTGGGGMIVSSDADFAKRCRYLSTQAKDNPIEYEHHEIGFNYRMTNVLAAIGCAQLERLAQYVKRKREIAGIYADCLAAVPGISLMESPPWSESTYWLYTVLVDKARFGLSARDIVYRLMSRGIQTRPLWQLLHLSQAFANSPTGFRASYPQAEAFHAQGLSLPCSVGISPSEIQTVCAELKKLAV